MNKHRGSCFYVNMAPGTVGKVKSHVPLLFVEIQTALSLFYRMFWIPARSSDWFLWVMITVYLIPWLAVAIKSIINYLSVASKGDWHFCWKLLASGLETPLYRQKHFKCGPRLCVGLHCTVPTHDPHGFLSIFVCPWEWERGWGHWSITAQEQQQKTLDR